MYYFSFKLNHCFCEILNSNLSSLRSPHTSIISPQKYANIVTFLYVGLSVLYSNRKIKVMFVADLENLDIFNGWGKPTIF